MTQQTAIDWFFDNLKNHEVQAEHFDLYKKAKEIEKQHIKIKYYFITYQATNREGSVGIWNQAIDKSPMEFIKKVQDVEERGSKTYREFVVLNTCEISEEDFNIYDGDF